MKGKKPDLSGAMKYHFVAPSVIYPYLEETVGNSH